ncbi:unnamed protein product, partial [Hydatigera taeniaeformis]|uniref:Fibronectin type-III domain-containing protein n=1 Tax=Hydatigena taeniaeformis TaxID=6205 RepID=A0A0R3WN78_HYDTA
MRKPTFKAEFLSTLSTLQISIDNPLGVEGRFEGYEVLMKDGGLVSVHPWRSVVNLSASERHYNVRRIQAPTLRSVTVRGRLSADQFSLSAPQNVKLIPFDSDRALMTWDPPIQSYGNVTGYSIVSRVGNETRPLIDPPPDRTYVFKDLKPNQTLSAFVFATSQPESQVNIKLRGYPSHFLSLTKPPATG